MSGYINSQGLSAGPLRITDITNTNYNGTWLLSYNGSLYVCNNWFLPSMSTTDVNESSLKPIYAKNSSSLSDDELATIATVKNLITNWNPETGEMGFDSRYASAEAMDRVNQVIYGPSGTGVYSGSGLISEMNTVISKVGILTTTVDSLVPQVATLTTNLSSLTDTVNTHIENPFPDGVIFIGGGA